MNHRIPNRRGLAASLLAAMVLTACSAEESPTPAPATPTPAAPSETGAPPQADAADAAAKEPAEESTADLVARGRSVWMSNCIACHAQDPTADGALGPAVAGSSRELIEARVLRAEYPPGYTPKRDSAIMIALPHLANDIDALAAYLNQ